VSARNPIGIRIRRRLGLRPRPHRVRFGNLRRLRPISPVFGFDRGLCIDRYYIENFLAIHSADIRGRVLEAQDDSYTRRFGGERVESADILDVSVDNPRATVVADLTRADEIADATYDCVVLTQVLHFVSDVRAALAEVHRVLKPGGVLLATGPGISQISRYDADRWGDIWRFSSQGLESACAAAFPGDEVTIEAHGNVLASIALLHGLSTEELRQHELDYVDPDYELLITLRAVKI
jgi:SAM-dependent methyltransferase